MVQLGRSEGSDVEMGRVVVLPSFSSLLSFYEHEVPCERRMGGVKDSPKLWCLRKGRLLSISERVKFVGSATYNCSQPFCMPFVKVFRTGQSAGVDEKPPGCLGCGSPLEEQFSKRDISGRVTGKLLVEGSHTLNAVFRYDEATLLQLGSDYSIIFTLGHERHGSS